MKDYKTILESVVNIINTTEKSDIGFANICTYIGEKCPELKESEDERIRKSITDFFKNYSKNGTWKAIQDVTKWITWLEKQDEQKPIKEHNACKFCEDRYGCVSPCPLKLIEEEKSADKVEPKFKVGDWVIGRATDNEPRQIAEIAEEGYKTTYGGWIGFSFEEDMRLWAIQDAKKGDILSTEPYSFPFVAIYENSGLDFFNSYCFVGFDGKFYEGSTGHSIENIHPATKEQRDTLMKAMADAGYTFDFEKKELKKIEQESTDKCMEWYDFIRWFVKQRTNDYTLIPSDDDIHKWGDNILNHAKKFLDKQNVAWNEEDEKMLDDILMCGEHHCYLDAENIDWLKSLKNKVQPRPTEWSEEDERTYKSIIYSFAHNYPLTIQQQEFIKSLRLQNHWKPSDEQMEAVRLAAEIGTANNSWAMNILKSMYQDLQKLREE